MMQERMASRPDATVIHSRKGIFTATATNSSVLAATPSDAELLTAMAQKQDWALAALYDRYAGVLYSLALKILSESAPAQDVVHETFLTAWRKAAMYSEARGQAATWLVVLCRNLAIDQYRARMRLVSRRIELDAAAEYLAAPDDDPALKAVAADDVRHLREALVKLPPEQKQVIEMAYFQGLSQTEISAATQTPLGTVKTRTRQALLKLREALAEPAAVD
jgi:RNA polymerase sigma-70 factor (ECF subfamily)